MTRHRWLPAFAVALAAQLVAVYAPSAPSEGGIPYLDKVVHATIFGLPVLFGLLAGWPRRWVVGVFVVHAGVSEYLQSAVLPHRDGSWQDALADLVGVGLGVLASSRVESRTRGIPRA
ncbi:hypothetical protein CLV35_2966 [Motilibacter peucedani]|uniref:VanZ like protein n=1 Tax=Motilibacter peucedani TaxID=598650 RepID=A0A420XN59_9ACTN|nr:VanZ family protein [Motilibacter peucedani]RKS72717.1 hypothetical protein CLV35_2966 [Motilibacter peucedani]